MKTVLVIGPRYFNFLDAVGSAFTTLGWRVITDAYDTPVHPYTGPARIRYKLSRDREGMKMRGREVFAGHITEVFETVRPDLVFILNGDIFETGTLDLFRKSSKTAIWFFDNIGKVRGAEENALHVDRVFSFDRKDTACLEKVGAVSSFLAQACDPDIYRPLGLERDIDILFVGNLFCSQKRKDTMLSVISRFPDRKIQVYGIYNPWYKGLKPWLKRPYKSVFRNCNLRPEMVNRVYNRSKVVLNIHQEEQQDGANPRVFEICGSGAYQICDSKPYLESLFPDSSVGLYSDTDQLFKLIEEALASDMPARSEAAHNIVMSGHLFRHRMEEVLAALGFVDK